MELKARNSEDQIDVPTVFRFNVPADIGVLRDTAFQMKTTVGSRRYRDSWQIQLPQAVTLSLSRVFVRRHSLTLTLSPYTTVVSKGNARRGTNVSAWFSDGTHDLSVTAGVAQDAERTVSTTLYANFGQAVTDALRGAADVTYEGGTGGDWIAASQAMTYQLMPALELALSSRQETSYAGIDKSVNLEVNVRLGR